MPQLPPPLPRSVEARPHDRRFDGLGFCLGGVTSGLDELIVMGMHSGTQGAALVRKRGAQNARRAGAPRAAAGKHSQSLTSLVTNLVFRKPDG